MKRRHLLNTALGLGAATAIPAWSQSYPNTTIKVIIPSAPGGLTDPIVRFLGDALQRSLGQSVVMEHRAGGGGIIGMQQVMRTAPDGYTLVMCSSGPMFLTPAMHPAIPYSFKRDFTPIGSLLTFENVLAVPVTSKAHSVADLIRMAKEKPGSVNFASAGIGASHHLSGELFKRMAGVDITHVPYKGSAPAQTDLIAGQVQMMFANIPAAINLIKTGRLRALAVTGTQRNAALPDVPTVAESGIPGFSVITAVALYGPAGIPRDVVMRLNSEINRIWGTPEGKKTLDGLYLTFTRGTPEDLGAWVDAETTKWTAVIKAAGIKSGD